MAAAVGRPFTAGTACPRPTPMAARRDSQAARRVAAEPALRSRCVPRAASFLPNLPDALKNFFRSEPRTSPASEAGLRKSRELLGLLVRRRASDGVVWWGPEDAQARARVDALLDDLAALTVPFSEQALSIGPGVVVYTRGQVALWDALRRPAPQLGSRPNRASQDLDASGRTVLSKSELWGPTLYVTAGGTYVPRAKEDGRCPVAVDVEVTGGALHWGQQGATLPLPFIRGTGLFEVVYADDVLRVFRSSGSWAVQVSEAHLESL